MTRFWIRIYCWWNGHDGEELLEVECPKWGVLVISYRCPCGRTWEHDFYTDDRAIGAWLAKLRDNA